MEHGEVRSRVDTRSRLADDTSKGMEICSNGGSSQPTDKNTIINNLSAFAYKMTDYSRRNIMETKATKIVANLYGTFLREPYLPYTNPIP
jgi:hypothetical protein